MGRNPDKIQKVCRGMVLSISRIKIPFRRNLVEMAKESVEKRVLQQLSETPVSDIYSRRDKRGAPVVVPEGDARFRKPNEFTPIQMLVAKWFAGGMKPPKIARKLQYHLVPNEPDDQKRIRKARNRLSKMLGTIKMRDLIYEEAKMLLDLESPAIMRGVARKAKAGRVDAARLAFELNGRHAPHTEIQPATINIVLGKIPRPGGIHQPAPDEDTVDAEVDEIEDIG